MEGQAPLLERDLGLRVRRARQGGKPFASLPPARAAARLPILTGLPLDSTAPTRMQLRTQSMATADGEAELQAAGI